MSTALLCTDVFWPLRGQFLSVLGGLRKALSGQFPPLLLQTPTRTTFQILLDIAYYMA